MDGYFITDCGQMRKINEDAGGIFYNKAGQLLAVVADGMGGHQAGEVASELAVSILQQKWEQITSLSNPMEAEEWAEKVLLKMNQKIYQRSMENEEYKGMGTTVVLSICTEEFVTIAHVGDSRCYILNEQQLEQLTSDHSLVNELIRTGQITEVDAEQHPRKNVLLKAVGTEQSIKPDIETISWEKTHCLLLCSDGLTNKLTDLELEDYLRNMDDIEATSKKLVHIANERGGEDNITLAIICNLSNEKVGESPC